MLIVVFRGDLKVRFWSCSIGYGSNKKVKFFLVGIGNFRFRGSILEKLCRKFFLYILFVLNIFMNFGK